MNMHKMSPFVITMALIITAIVAVVGYSYIAQPEHEEVLEQWVNSGDLHPTIIHHPETIPMVDSGKKLHDGSAAMVRCNTCHSTKTPNVNTNSSDQLDEFHQNMKFTHQSLKCVSCHNANDYESLHLADGQSIPFTRVMELCAQCHGPQYRDYRNGSHGGMSGYWDLRRGPRIRNGCTDCHDPHAPAFPKVLPVFPPKKRTGTQSNIKTH